MLRHIFLSLALVLGTLTHANDIENPALGRSNREAGAVAEAAIGASILKRSFPSLNSHNRQVLIRSKALEEKIAKISHVLDPSLNPEVIELQKKLLAERENLAHADGALAGYATAKDLNKNFYDSTLTTHSDAQVAKVESEAKVALYEQRIQEIRANLNQSAGTGNLEALIEEQKVLLADYEEVSQELATAYSTQRFHIGRACVGAFLIFDVASSVYYYSASDFSDFNSIGVDAATNAIKAAQKKLGN